MAKLNTLVDDFDDNAINDVIWSSFGSIAETSGRIVFSHDSALPDYAGLSSQALYDATDSFVFVEIFAPGNGAWASLESTLQLKLNHLDANTVYIGIIGGNLVARRTVANVPTDMGTPVTYNHTTMRYLRIRETSGTFYLEYTSAAGFLDNTWTTFASASTPFDFTTIEARFQSGFWDTESGTTSVSIDNFNILPRGKRSAGFFSII